MGELRESLPELAEARHEGLLGERLQVGYRLEPAVLHAPRRDRADAVDLAHRQRRQKALRFGLAYDREAARLLQLGCQLGEELVAREADGHGDADLALHAGGDQRQCFGGRRRLGAVVVGEVEIGFVERDRLDDGGGRSEDGADVGADALVLGHVRGDDGGVRAQLERLEHRHGGATAEFPRDVAGGGDHAAAPGVADDQRLLCQLRPIALLDRGVERIAVDVRDAKSSSSTCWTSRVPSQRAQASSGTSMISQQSRQSARVMCCQQILSPRQGAMLEQPKLGQPGRR